MTFDESKLKMLCQSGAPFAVVTIMALHGSAPRGEGARLLLWEGGKTGTVGGGALEVRAEALAKQVLQEKQSKVTELIMRPGADTGSEAEVDMLCGGNVTLLIEYMESAAQSGTWPFSDCSHPGTSVIICGAGHVGTKLATIIQYWGQPVTVIDSRPEFVTQEQFPYANTRLCPDYSGCFDGIPVTTGSCIVILTQGHRYDTDVAKQALLTDAGYIGMIGSRKKVEMTRVILREQGFTDEQINRIHMPVGLQIGAETPEELAICIVAEIISEVTKNNGNSHGNHGCPMH